MLQNILFATDLGPYSTQILQHVMALAAQQRAKVFVLHAVEPIHLIADKVVQDASFRVAQEDTQSGNQQQQLSGLPFIMHGIRDKVMELLEDEYIDGNLESDVVRDVIVKQGKPAEVILEQAEECRADLLVLGSHCGFSRHPDLLGSVSSKVLQLSPIPVYLVPLMKSTRLRDLA